MANYIDHSARIIKDEEIEPELRKQRIQEKDLAHRHQSEKSEGELCQINQQLGQLQLENDQSIRQLREGKERPLGHCDVNKQLKESVEVVSQFERQVAEFEQRHSQREQPQNSNASNGGKELTSFKLRWRKGKRAPQGISRWCDAVVDGNIVYVKDRGVVKIYCYNHVTDDSWSQLPNCVHENGSITVINGWLTTVGGGRYPIYFNELFSLTGKDSDRRWTKKFPPMPTKRMDTTALYTGTTLIIAGGEGEGFIMLSTVEVMNTETHQWSTAAALPEPVCKASATVCGDRFYMLGGTDTHSFYTKSAYTCSVSVLLQSCVSSRPQLATSNNFSRVWSQLADLPVVRSTCESFYGRLLAVGGLDNGSKEPSATAVYMYDSSTNSWEIISRMMIGRCACDCFTAVLPDNQLMVVGGETDRGIIGSVELASVYD